MKEAAYPGTFDPITNGHLDIIERSLKIFDKLTVLVAQSQRKQPFIPFEERVKLIQKSTAHLPNVKVEGFSNLLIDCLHERGIRHVIRGLRAVSDFEYELQLALMNRQLSPEMETIFLMPRQKYIFLSSNMVREIGTLGGCFQDFVPQEVHDDIKLYLQPGT
ncbi:pantetheine-phosphate adenylyltransferase [Desulfurispira natronophila]|uniref:Phosphopantetheine adenylyltransferase n=1 Tax=Desulfurispira natronophila TaxID=682562 RepID=A0A7W8DHI5_9BACT|nr:pantetheine-phosphate adenylyltransferase [Desulfurispira natronophila]MBB5022323.1 pantetheine-phosphate adenylyltransferase [Desulfurispira natronophila]